MGRIRGESSKAGQLLAAHGFFGHELFLNAVRGGAELADDSDGAMAARARSEKGQQRGGVSKPTVPPVLPKPTRPTREGVNIADGPYVRGAESSLAGDKAAADHAKAAAKAAANAAAKAAAAEAAAAAAAEAAVEDADCVMGALSKLLQYASLVEGRQQAARDGAPAAALASALAPTPPPSPPPRLSRRGARQQRAAKEAAAKAAGKEGGASSRPPRTTNGEADRASGSPPRSRRSSLGGGAPSAEVTDEEMASSGDESARRVRRVSPPVLFKIVPFFVLVFVF